VLPGFGLTLGYSLTYLGLIVLIPLSAAFLKTSSLTWSEFVAATCNPRVIASYKLSFGASFAAASVNSVFGLLAAWVLTRYQFPGKKIFDAMVDLPFALPTAVAGIALTTIYSPKGWIGGPLYDYSLQLRHWLDSKGSNLVALLPEEGIRISYTAFGIFLALTFIGLPFVVRTLQPVMEDMEPELEEVSATLGASRWQTFTRVLFPALLPPLLTGFALAFARALGEYGSVVFIASNMPYKTEITPLLIYAQLDQNKYSQATAIAVVLLVASFCMLLVINLLQRWAQSRAGSSP